MVDVKGHKKTINGKQVVVKSYKRKEPIKTASEYLKGLKAPLEDKSGEMKVQFSINVPSTKEHSKPISKKEFDKRVHETEEFLSSTFGGNTSVKAEGGYVENGQLITEGVTRVESSMSVNSYKKNKHKLEKFISSKQKEWSQDTIGYNFEGDFHMYPKQKWMKDYNVIDN